VGGHLAASVGLSELVAMWVGPAWEAYQLCPATLYFYFKLEECGPVQEEIVELGWVAGFAGGVEFDPPKEVFWVEG
jgi:hypothetical protein